MRTLAGHDGLLVVAKLKLQMVKCTISFMSDGRVKGWTARVRMYNGINGWNNGGRMIRTIGGQTDG